MGFTCQQCRSTEAMGFGIDEFEVCCSCYRKEIRDLRAKLADVEKEIKRIHNEAIDCAHDQWARSEVLKDENKKLREVLRSIQQYGSDTLSGRMDGPDDREWQREAVVEMTRRARLGLEEVT